MNRVLLVRHATNDTVGRLVAGWTPSLHLDEEGRASVSTLEQDAGEARLVSINDTCGAAGP
jgi:broad specificity phosphatase PhoE